MSEKFYPTNFCVYFFRDIKKKDLFNTSCSTPCHFHMDFGLKVIPSERLLQLQKLVKGMYFQYARKSGEALYWYTGSLTYCKQSVNEWRLQCLESIELLDGRGQLWLVRAPQLHLSVLQSGCRSQRSRLATSPEQCHLQHYGPYHLLCKRCRDQECDRRQLSHRYPPIVAFSRPQGGYLR